MNLTARGSRVAAQGTVLTAAALLFFVDLFLPWAQSCGNVVISPPLSPGPVLPGPNLGSFLCPGQTGGWGGAGTVAGVLVGLLFLWEATRVARLELGLSLGYRSLLSAALCLGVVVFTVIEVVALLTWDAPQSGALLYGGLFLWIALALALLIGLGGLAHWRIWNANGPAPIHP